MSGAVEKSVDSSDLSPRVFEIVRAAVNLARNEQIKTVEMLRSRLDTYYPNSHADIEAALDTWRRYAWPSVMQQIVGVG